MNYSNPGLNRDVLTKSFKRQEQRLDELEIKLSWLTERLDVLGRLTSEQSDKIEILFQNVEKAIARLVEIETKRTRKRKTKTKT